MISYYLLFFMSFNQKPAEFKYMTLIELGKELESACRHGQLDLVQYLLCSPKLETHININYKNDVALRTACEYGHFNIVQYLLTSSDLDKHSYILTCNNNAFYMAIHSGNVELVDYMINSPELDIRIDYCAIKHIVFSYCIEIKNIGMIKYFLSSPTLDFAQNISFDFDAIWKYAYTDRNIDFMTYLLMSPELKFHSDPNGDNFCHYLINNKETDIIQYLLTSDLFKIIDFNLLHKNLLLGYAKLMDQKMVEFLLYSTQIQHPIFEFANYKSIIHEVFYECTNNNDLATFQLLFKSPDENRHPNLYDYDYKHFKRVHSMQHMDLLEFLIVDYGIKKNANLEAYIEENHHDDLKVLFRKREYAVLKNKLEDNLGKVSSNTKKIKV